MEICSVWFFEGILGFTSGIVTNSRLKNQMNFSLIFDLGKFPSSA